jgi:hypothetical protein
MDSSICVQDGSGARLSFWRCHQTLLGEGSKNLILDNNNNNNNNNTINNRRPGLTSVLIA